MDVHAFKGIFWLEYLHRLLGRMIGVVFLFPFLFFIARGYITGRRTPKYVAMFVLGGLQGVLGWYMVKSGLIDHPEVSQYRLTAHLLLAMAIYAFMLWVALGLRQPRGGPRHPWLGRSLGLVALVVITITSGGFVAGTKAGFAFNTFPMMGEHWIPPGMMVLDPVWRNLFDNIVMVQFNHRVLAFATFALIVLYGWFAARGGLHGQQRMAAYGLLVAAVMQVTLGIATIVHSVPIALGSAHQAGAMVLLTASIYLLHALRTDPDATR
jgi:cytochrome c oxidase assembly protein subunit 15